MIRDHGFVIFGGFMQKFWYCFVSCFLWFSVEGLQVTPCSGFTLTPSKLNKEYVSVYNEADEEKNYKVFILQMDFDEQGKQADPIETSIEDCMKDLVVFPSSFVIPPKSSRKIRVMLRNPQAISASKGYYLVCEEPPVNQSVYILDEEGKVDDEMAGGVALVLRVLTPFFIQMPVKEKSPIEVVKSSIRQTEDGDTFLDVSLRNKGQLIERLHKTQASLTFQGKKNVKLPKFLLSEDACFVCPGKEVSISVPIDVKEKNVDLDGSIKLTVNKLT